MQARAALSTPGTVVFQAAGIDEGARVLKRIIVGLVGAGVVAYGGVGGSLPDFVLETAPRLPAG